jgi:hypothetical protein
MPRGRQAPIIILATASTEPFGRSFRTDAWKRLDPVVEIRMWARVVDDSELSNFLSKTDIEGVVMRRISRVTWLLPLFAAVVAPVALAADHADGPAAKADPSTDIADVFAWVKNGKTYLVMDIGKDMPATAKFSNSAKYVFHTTSAASYGAATKKSLDVICTFNAAQTVQCWVGDKEYVTGDASKAAGLSSKDGMFKVFAGLRNDPFFFNLTGFQEVAAAVHGAATDTAHPLTFEDGCPALDKPTADALVGFLSTSPDGGKAVDAFAKFNTLAIVMELDTTLVNAGGPILGVWASTNK